MFQKSFFVTFSKTTSHLHRQNLLNAVQSYDSKTESDRLSSPIEVLRNSLKMRLFWRKFQAFFILYFAKSRYIKCSYPSFSSLTEKKEIICVLFFPLQIRIYFEFLVPTRYELLFQKTFYFFYFIWRFPSVNNSMAIRTNGS